MILKTAVAFVIFRNSLAPEILPISEREELEWDKYYDNLWSLIGYIKLDISSGRLVAGNALLPSMAVLSFENYTCKMVYKKQTIVYRF